MCNDNSFDRLASDLTHQKSSVTPQQITNIFEYGRDYPDFAQNAHNLLASLGHKAGRECALLTNKYPYLLEQN